MCVKSPKIEPPKPPPPPPPPPKPIEFGGSSASQTARKGASARKALSIPLSMGGTDSGSGLNIPK